MGHDIPIKKPTDLFNGKGEYSQLTSFLLLKDFDFSSKPFSLSLSLLLFALRICSLSVSQLVPPIYLSILIPLYLKDVSYVLLKPNLITCFIPSVVTYVAASANSNQCNLLN